MDEFAVGDRVHSIYGLEHVGTVVEVGSFTSGQAMYRVRRDLDGFVWIGMLGTLVGAATLN
jgi:hypothetical protein